MKASAESSDNYLQVYRYARLISHYTPSFALQNNHSHFNGLSLKACFSIGITYTVFNTLIIKGVFIISITNSVTVY